MKNLWVAIVLVSVFSVEYASEVKASPGHDHGEKLPKSSGVKRPEARSENPFLTGSSFEVVFNSCEKGKMRLYVADRETNQPISKATITIQGSGSHSFTTESSATQQAGEYIFDSPIKEGDKIDLKISIKEATRAETLSTLIAQWPKCIEPTQEKKHA
ncbi:MAG: hypothetical protein NWR39_01945 [Pseudomonadota bacterium]|nr:hypothetical protein [Pseudomonadota bacterium]